jgi:hypothetical protein
MSYNNHVQTSLYAAITSGSTDIQIWKAAAPFQNPPTDGYLTIADSLYAATQLEIISYTGLTDNGTFWELTGVVRGLGGTAAQDFPSSSPAYQAIFASDFGIKGGLIDIQTFTSGSGTWNKPAGATKFDVECIGGGGGGGGGGFGGGPDVDGSQGVAGGSSTFAGVIAGGGNSGKGGEGTGDVPGEGGTATGSLGCDLAWGATSGVRGAYNGVNGWGGTNGGPGFAGLISDGGGGGGAGGGGVTGGMGGGSGAYGSHAVVFKTSGLGATEAYAVGSGGSAGPGGTGLADAYPGQNGSVRIKSYY